MICVMAVYAAGYTTTETGLSLPCCNADIRSFSLVSPHFFPPTDFQPDSAPFTSAPCFFEQGESDQRSHWVPFPSNSGAMHGKSLSVQTVWLTANFRALKFHPPLHPVSTQSTNSCSEKLLRCIDVRVTTQAFRHSTVMYPLLQK